MLILRRRDGQWVKVTCRNGDTLWVRAYNIRFDRGIANVDLAFEDPTRNFEIERPERIPAEVELRKGA